MFTYPRELQLNIKFTLQTKNIMKIIAIRIICDILYTVHHRLFLLYIKQIHYFSKRKVSDYMNYSNFDSKAVFSKQETLAEKAFIYLRDIILSGKIKKGTKLYEVSLTEELGISRTPIREALKRLSHLDLIQTVPRKYYIVKGISTDEIIEIYNICALLEPYAAKNAALNEEKKYLDFLKKCVDDGYRYFEENDVDGIAKANFIFHNSILEMNSSRIQNTIEPLRDFIFGFRLQNLYYKQRAQETIREHDYIYRAISKGDCEMAGKLMYEHIENGKIHMINILQKRKEEV